MKFLLELVAVPLMVAVWYVGLWALMFGGWIAFERYKDGNGKDRTVVNCVLLLLAVYMWAATTFRK